MLLSVAINLPCHLLTMEANYEGWNFNSGNYLYLFTTDTK